jgi:hypothetical protein
MGQRECQNGNQSGLPNALGKLSHTSEIPRSELTMLRMRWQVADAHSSLSNYTFHTRFTVSLRRDGLLVPIAR